MFWGNMIVMNKWLRCEKGEQSGEKNGFAGSVKRDFSTFT